MLMNTGYLYGADKDIADAESSFVVVSCGHYKLLRQAQMVTHRPGGRQDYQLLYVAGGQAGYVVNGRQMQVAAGGLVLYRPGTPQRMEYHLEEKPDIYWMHFSGREAAALLQTLGYSGECVFDVGASGEYTRIFEQMIQELHRKEPGCQQLATGLGMELLSLMARGFPGYRAQARARGSRVAKLAQSMHENCAQSFSVEACAAQCGLSVCGFIRQFKAHTGSTPNQYLIQLRMYKAMELLLNTGYTVAEIAALVGYENPLYFSRLFHKKMKMSPSQYRRG